MRKLGTLPKIHFGKYTLRKIHFWNIKVWKLLVIVVFSLRDPFCFSLAVTAFRKYITSRGPRTLCDGYTFTVEIWKCYGLTNLLTAWPGQVLEMLYASKKRIRANSIDSVSTNTSLVMMTGEWTWSFAKPPCVSAVKTFSYWCQWKDFQLYQYQTI